MSKAKAIELNIDETKDFIKHMVSNNRFIQEQGKVPIAVEVEGDSGLGKTSAIMQVCKELGFKSENVVKLNLSQIEEIGDLVGFCLRQFEMCRKPVKPGIKLVTKIIDGKPQQVPAESADEAVTPDCIWVDEQAIPEYSKNGFSFTGEKRMSYCAPEWIANKTGGGVLILDDYSRADNRFLQAVMEICDRQTYISWKLPKDWHIILTSNPDNGDYLVTTMDNAQKTRFISINLKYDIDVWGRWAEKEGIDTRCINFMLMHPELVTKDVNPRSITNFFNSISSIKKFEDQLPLIEMIGEGSVGPEFAQMFVIFINNKLDKLPTPGELITNPDKDAVINKIESVVHKGDKYRADIASVLVTRLLNYSLTLAENNPVSEAMVKRLIMFVTTEVFTNDLKYYFMKQLINGNKIKFQKVIMDKEVMKMTVSN